MNGFPACAFGSCFDRAIHTDPHTDRSAVDVLCRERFLRPDDAAILIHILFLPTKGLELPMDLSRERLEQLLECQRLFQLLCSAHLFLIPDGCWSCCTIAATSPSSKRSCTKS